MLLGANWTKSKGLCIIPGMWKSVKKLLVSKKFMVATVSAIVWGVGRVGLDMDTEVVTGIVTPLWIFVFGQGLADLGKSKAEIEAGAKPTDTEPTE